MSWMKRKLKHAASVIPAIRRLLAERDALRLENEKSAKDLCALQLELRTLRRQFVATWQQLPQTWVPPGHFYSPIPSIAEVKINEQEIFEHPTQIRGIELNESKQVDLLKQIATFYGEQP